LSKYIYQHLRKETLKMPSGAASDAAKD
jgi:hypothetical protein